MKKLLVTLLIAAVLLGIGTSYFACQTIARQCGIFAIHDSEAMLTLPNGTRCGQYTCGPMEALVTDLFFLGEPVEADHPVLAGTHTPDKAVQYYRIRGRDNLSAMILKSDGAPTRIIMPRNHSAYCFSSVLCTDPKNHSEIFPVIMEDFYGCTDASDIAAIHIEGFTNGSTRAFTDMDGVLDPVSYTDRETIETVWDILLQGQYTCGLTGWAPDGRTDLPYEGTCEDHLQIQLDTVMAKRCHFPIVYLIALEFTDGSRLYFRFFSTESQFLFDHQFAAVTDRYLEGYSYSAVLYARHGMTWRDRLSHDRIANDEAVQQFTNEAIVFSGEQMEAMRQALGLHIEWDDDRYIYAK